jgi:hypothetical protein
VPEAAEEAASPALVDSALVDSAAAIQQRAARRVLDQALVDLPER